MILFFGFDFLIFVNFRFCFLVANSFFNTSSEAFTQPSSATLKLKQVVLKLDFC